MSKSLNKYLPLRSKLKGDIPGLTERCVRGIDFIISKRCFLFSICRKMNEEMPGKVSNKSVFT